VATTTPTTTTPTTTGPARPSVLGHMFMEVPKSLLNSNQPTGLDIITPRPPDPAQYDVLAALRSEQAHAQAQGVVPPPPPLTLKPNQPFGQLFPWGPGNPQTAK
jgi:hypothetical protein